MGKYNSEEEMLAAVGALDIADPAYEQKFKEIQNSEIDDTLPATPPTPPAEPQEPLSGPPAPAIPPAAPPEDEIFSVKKSELPSGFSSVPEVLKSYTEKEDLIRRQQEMINDLISKRPAETPAAPVKPAEIPATPVPQLDGLLKKYEAIGTLQAELDALVDADEDNFHTTDYQKKQRQLTKLQTELIGELNKNQSSVYEIAKKANEASAEYAKRTKEEQERAEAANRLDALYKEVDEIDIPEVKMSKPSKQVEKEYYDYRKKVATACFNRPPASTEEELIALEQLQLKNPKLLSTCQIMGIPQSIPDDVQKYMNISAVRRYQLGWRTDSSGRETRVTQFDPVTGQHVPYVIPSIRQAIELQRVESGYYKDKAAGEFQRGTQAAAAAAMRRDEGAVEFDSQRRGVDFNVEWATMVIENADMAVLMREEKRGNKAPMEEFERAQKILGYKT